PAEAPLQGGVEPGGEADERRQLSQLLSLASEFGQQRPGAAAEHSVLVPAQGDAPLDRAGLPPDSEAYHPRPPSSDALRDDAALAHQPGAVGPEPRGDVTPAVVVVGHQLHGRPPW